MKALDSVRIFVTAVHKGSLLAAGRSLGLSAATVSRRISALEEELGVQLLDRVSRTLKTTEAGKIYFQHAQGILEAVAQAEEATRTLSSRPEGRLRVHARTMIGMRLIAPRMKAFGSRYPSITVDLILSDEPVNIVEHDFDVDIRTGRINDSSFALKRLTTLHDVLVASPEYIRRTPAITQPADLLRHNCMTYRKSQEPTFWQYKDPAAEGTVRELAIQGNFHSNSGEVLRQSALAGMGIALLAEPHVRESLREGSLVRVLPDVPFTNSTFDNGVFAVFRAGAALPQKVRHFIDFLSETLG